MNTTQLKTYLRVLYKQGILTGDLNRVQQFCLNWALVEERNDQLSLEEERMRYTVLAGDKDLYRHLFITQEDVLQMQEDEWKSAEEFDPHEMETLFEELEAWESQRDEGV